MPADAQQKTEAYLASVRGQLRGFSDQQVAEIVAELRSHIMDKLAAAGERTGAQLDAILVALGGPDELASQYVTDDLLARAEVSRSPFRILGSLFRWASLSVAGFFVLISSMVGYFLGIAFTLVAILKPFHPSTAGLWLLHDNTGDPEISLRLGFSDVPPVGRDLLGWWIVPVGLLGGCLFVMLTTWFALWCVRQYRRSRALPRG